MHADNIVSLLSDRRKAFLDHTALLTAYMDEYDWIVKHNSESLEHTGSSVVERREYRVRTRPHWRKGWVRE